MASSSKTENKRTDKRRAMPIEPSIDEAKPLYFLPGDNLAEEVLIPGFALASSAVSMVGFFSSASLADLAPGLATYIQNAPATFRLIISPFLSAVDQEAIKASLRKPEDVASEVMASIVVTADELEH